jgi:hypothetical protein
MGGKKMTDNQQLPAFASNRPDLGQTVGSEVSRLFKILRTKFNPSPDIAIATAYINVGGFSLLADELEKAPRIRLLLGAEPEQELVRQLSEGTGDYDNKVSGLLNQHEEWLRAERDNMGFSFEVNSEAKRLVAWLQAVDPEGKARVEVRRYTEGFLHGKAYIVDDPTLPAVLAGSSNMTRAGLSLNAELNVGYPAGDALHGAMVVDWFNHYWASSEAYDLASVYSHLWDEHTPWIIFMRMLWELYSANLADEKPAENLKFELAGFQADGVLRMKRLLENLGGVLVADEVGLGKTYLAAEVIHEATEINRQKVMIICPAALKKSMWEPFLHTNGFRLYEVYSYEEIRNRMDLEDERYDAWRRGVDDFAMIVVDEAHNLRNAGAQRSEAVDRVILGGRFPKKVVLLTATPVNNSLADLETLIKYFVRDDAHFAAINIPSIRGYIKKAQALEPENLTPEHLFDLMDQVAVRRTRKFVKEQYPNETIRGRNGEPLVIKFPKPKVRRIDYDLDAEGLALVDAMIYALNIPEGEALVPPYSERKADPGRLMLARYASSRYLISGDIEGFQVSNSGLLRSALLKRLESSPAALKKTLSVLIVAHKAFLSGIDSGYVLIGEALRDWASSESDDLETFVLELDEDDADQAQSVSLYHHAELKEDVETDLVLLESLLALTESAVKTNDTKAVKLIAELTKIAAESETHSASGISSGDRRKVIIFSTYSDTILDLFDRVKTALDANPTGALKSYVGRLPGTPVMGSLATTQRAGKTGGVDQNARAAIIDSFAPETAGALNSEGHPLAEDKYDILLTTDVLAEGVNLQQAGHIINYDLPWNPMRIVQRHGRVDRIGSKHETVELGLFFPGERLDAFLALEETLERKLAQAEAAVGASNVLPGRKTVLDVNFADSLETVTKMEEILENRGNSAAVSGEEYRRRLFTDINVNLRQPIIEMLPYGSGSGFENPRVAGNSFVFCIKIADSEKPWFRYVPVDENWNLIGDDENHGVSSDTLKSLVAADPRTDDQPRWLTDEVYSSAFTAWNVAQNDAFETWSKMTDPATLEAEPPKAFRDAFQLVLRDGTYLGGKTQSDLMKRLKNVPSNKVAKSIRRAIRTEGTVQHRINAILQAVLAAGLQPAGQVEALPEVTQNEVRLVVWMAVKGTLPTQH